MGAALDIFQLLITELDTEGRYLFLNAVANQLRYPNNHTHYFSFILLYLFAESNQVSMLSFDEGERNHQYIVGSILFTQFYSTIGLCVCKHGLLRLNS